LDAIGADVGQHRLDLAAHEIGTDGKNAGNAARVLHRQRGNCRRGVTAQRRYRLDIRLDARAAARIRAGDDQHAAGHSAALSSACPAAASAAAISSTTEATSDLSSPSAMMRIRGSVPDLRTSRRPLAPRRLCPALMAARMSLDSSAAPPLTRTLRSNCGTGSKTLHTWLACAPVSAMAASTCKAAIRPSPVVEWSPRMMWPDCSPPRLQPS